jgi:hypothetical protein
MSEIDLLRRLGDQIVPPSIGALRETARRRARRTATVTAVLTAAAVVVGAGGVQLAVTEDHSAPPVEQPQDDGIRPLTYAEGATVHYGDHAVTLPSAAVELDLTDNGVAARTDTGEIWFTDGADLEQVGTLGTPAPSFDPTEMSHGSPDVAFGTSSGLMVSGTSGSLVAWFEFPQPGQPEVVAYDTSSRTQEIRQPIELDPGHSALLESVTDQFAYWFVDPEPFDLNGPNARVDLATGEITSITPRQYDAENPGPAPGTPQTLLVSHHEGGGGPYEVDDGIHMQLGMHGGHVEPLGEQPLEVLDGPTRTPLTALAWPVGYKIPDAPGFVTQWVDADAFVIGYRTARSTDLLVCHVSSTACAVAVQTASVLVLPELGDLPDFG